MLDVERVVGKDWGGRRQANDGASQKGEIGVLSAVAGRDSTSELDGVKDARSRY